MKTAIEVLPIEILTQILLLCIPRIVHRHDNPWIPSYRNSYGRSPQQVRETLMSVCSSWKAVIINTPLMWTQLAYTDSPLSMQAATDNDVAQAKGLPLDVVFIFSVGYDLSCSNGYVIFSTFHYLIQRCRTFHAHLFLNDYNEEICRMFPPNLIIDCPHLHTFTLRIHGPQVPSKITPIGRIHAPNLRILHLERLPQGLFQSRPPAAVQTLGFRSVATTRPVDNLTLVRPSRSHFTQCYHLKHLIWRMCTSTAREACTVIFPEVKRFEFEADAADGAILRTLHLPRLETLYLNVFKGFSLSKMFIQQHSSISYLRLTNATLQHGTFHGLFRPLVHLRQLHLAHPCILDNSFYQELLPADSVIPCPKLEYLELEVTNVAGIAEFIVLRTYAHLRDKLSSIRYVIHHRGSRDGMLEALRGGTFDLEYNASVGLVFPVS